MLGNFCGLVKFYFFNIEAVHTGATLKLVPGLEKVAICWDKDGIDWDFIPRDFSSRHSKEAEKIAVNCW